MFRKRTYVKRSTQSENTTNKKRDWAFIILCILLGLVLLTIIFGTFYDRRSSGDPNQSLENWQRNQRKYN